MSLQGKIVLVTGASGTVGAGILDQVLRAGATVVAPIRSGKDALLQSLGDLDVSKLDVPTAVVTDETSVLKLASYIKEKYGGLDHAVTCVGGWWQKVPLLQVSTDEFLETYKTYVLSHLLLAKHLLPLIKPAKASSFTFVTGGAGEGVILLDSGLVTAHVAGLYGVIMAVQAEYKDKDTRVNELRIKAVVRRHKEKVNEAIPDAIRNATGEFSHRAIGKAIVDLILDVSGGDRLQKLGTAELQQLEASQK